MMEEDLRFNFIVLGNKMLNRHLMNKNPEISPRINNGIEVKLNKVSQFNNNIWFQYLIQYDDLGDFLENLPRKIYKTYRNLRISTYDALIFTSLSLKDTEQLLQQSNREELLATADKHTPVIVVVFKKEELYAIREYHMLFSNYWELDEQNISIHHMGELFDQNIVLKRIQQEFLLQTRNDGSKTGQ